jgi:alkanesulfonate monooxygenase SsuD/methylene tetrahydromethanopterin reductase-like flavin-dependent oxidoreductase (luciferase family)
LREAYAFPVPDPAPRIVVAGASPAGARRAARIGDAWTCRADDVERLRPAFDAAALAAGRDPAGIPIVVEVPAADAIADLDGLAHRWAERAIGELVIGFVRQAQLGPLLDAAARSTALARAGSREVR